MTSLTRISPTVCLPARSFAKATENTERIYGHTEPREIILEGVAVAYNKEGALIFCIVVQAWVQDSLGKK